MGVATPSRRESASARAVRLINELTHTGDFARQPFNLRPWQASIIRNLFKTGPNGLRVYRTSLLMFPRKNGKTELAAAIAIYALLFDGATGGEIYLAAADREQASKVFQAMVAMIEHDAELSAMCEIIPSQKRIVHRASKSFAHAISAEAYSKHGFNASVVIYDELHCAPNRELWDVLVTSQGARLQPLMIAISTAGYDRHSILWELYSHAKKVQETPALDPTFLPIIYEAPIDADWTDEKVWKQANPALGDFRSLEEMRIACQRAKVIPAQENAFRRLYLNQWTEQAERWISLASWDACRSELKPDAFRASLKGRRCFVGLDLSATKDLTAAVAIFPDETGFDVLTALFCPLESIRERSLRDRVPYDQWHRDVWTTQPHALALNGTPGNVVDYQAVRRLLNQWAKEFVIRDIGYDKWNATELIRQLTQEDGLPCVEVRQTLPNLTAATKALEKAILNQELRHDGHPGLRWNLSNVAVASDDAGNVTLSKKVSTEKIDGASALVNAVHAMLNAAPVPEPQFQMFTVGSRT